MSFNNVIPGWIAARLAEIKTHRIFKEFKRND